MRLGLFFLILAAAAPARADDAVELFSIARSSLSAAEVGDIIESQAGKIVAVGDRLVDEGESQKIGRDAPLTKPQGDALVAARRKVRLDRLRAAARDGSLTLQDRAEARALCVIAGASFDSRDRYFLDTLNPDAIEKDKDPLIAAAASPGIPDPGTPGAPDPLLAQMRRALIFDDHGDPAQAEALDGALRLMMQSPTARALSAEFLALNRRVTVSFETLPGVVATSGNFKYLAGIGGETQRADKDRVRINIGYLQTPETVQFHDLPGTLAHELLGHDLNGTRADAAGVTPAMNRWDGDEDLAGVTGWLVQSEVDGKVGVDSYLWAYLNDPAAYRRARHLITPYYAESYSPDEAGRLDQVYAERLGRVDARRAFLNRRYDAGTDWVKAIDHFVDRHGVERRRVAGVRSDAEFASTEAAHAELQRLDAIHDALTKDLKNGSDPVVRSERADAAKAFANPFFADADKRLAAMTEKLRALATKNPPNVYKPAADEIGWSDLMAMYDDDRRDHPDHWAVAPSTAPPAAAPK